MSCENPGADPDALMPRKRKFDRSNSCIRCKQSAGNIVIRHAVYCKGCFLPLVTHRFRRGLEPSINPTGQRRSILKPSGNLLIGFSGGLGSTVLLDLVHRCYYSEESKISNQEKGGKDYPRNNVWKKVSVCYIDICEAYPEKRNRVDGVQDLMKVYPDFDFIPLRLSHAFDQDWWHNTGVNSSSPTSFATSLIDEELPISSCLLESGTPEDRLKSYLSSLPTQTSLHSTIQILIRVLLLYTAQSTDSSHLLFGTSLTSLAISLISSISQGAGFNVRDELQEEWTTAGRSVRVVRPLRDIGMKECAAYAWWMGLTVVGKEKWPGAKQGISGLTKDFIVGLERDYPSTVSTITRTCAKLAPKDDASHICVLCQRPVQPGLQQWKSRISIRSFEVEEEKTSSSPSLVPHLCYACHTTLTSKSSRGMVPAAASLSPVALPMWTQSGLSNTQDEELWNGKVLTEDQMKNAVGSFLLDPEG